MRRSNIPRDRPGRNKGNDWCGIKIRGGQKPPNEITKIVTGHRI